MGSLPEGPVGRRNPLKGGHMQWAGRRSGSGLPNFASLTIGAIERGGILATQPYHTTRAAQVVDKGTKNTDFFVTAVSQ
jgi:hypothetical protein